MKAYRTNWYFDWTNADEYNMYALSKEKLEEEIKKMFDLDDMNIVADYQYRHGLGDEIDELIEEFRENPIEYLEKITGGNAHGYIEEIEIME